MQTASSRIWIWVTDSISYDNDYYANCSSSIPYWSFKVYQRITTKIGVCMNILNSDRNFLDFDFK